MTHNLLFVLAGVRISAFVSSDDKRPLQKSIIGFLQHGKTDSRESAKPIHQKNEKDCLPNCSVQTWPLACLTSAQTGQRPEEVPVWRKQKGSKGKKTGEELQQSFFQRAHARRLKIQAMNAITPQDNAAMESSTRPREDNCLTSDLSEDHCPSHTEALASTSGCGGKVSDSLDCPVCFRRVETTDLNVFNRHIDQCLSDASKNPSSSDSESDLDQENNHKECELVEKQRGLEAEVSANNKELECTGANAVEDQQSLRNGSNTAALLVNDGNKTNQQNPQTCNNKAHVLICPICQLTQDSDDLIVFNQHVDLCLNQEALHELEGETSCSKNPSLVANNKPCGKYVY